MIDGSFYLWNETAPDEQNEVDIPVCLLNEDEVQVIISEYTINSALESVTRLDLLNTTMNMSSSSVNTAISDFTYAFGEDLNTTIYVHPNAKSVPFLDLQNETSVFTALIDMHIKNPKNLDIDAALITTTITCNVEFDVDSDFKLTGKVSEFVFQVK